MYCNSLGCASLVNFPILTVTGSGGLSGNAGADGTSVIFDNTLLAAVATSTTSWEQFTGMASGAITDLATNGCKLRVRAEFIPGSPTSNILAPIKARIKVDGVIIGDASSYEYIFEYGTTKVIFDVVLTRVDSTHIFAQVIMSSILAKKEVVLSGYTEMIAVTNAASLSGVTAEGKSNVIGDLSCRQLYVELLTL